MWAAFSVAGFLATWTLPSGALLLLALGGWGSITAWRRQGMLGARAAVIATTAAAAASGLAYVSVFDELVKASERWGVRVWAASDDSLWALFSGGSLLVGGPSPLPSSVE